MQSNYLSDLSNEAIQRYFSRLSQEGVVALLALLPEDEKEAVSRLQAEANRVGIQLLGAIFPELIHDGAFCRKGALLLESATALPHRLLTGLTVATEREQAINELVVLADGIGVGGNLLLLFDGQFPQVASLLDELYFELGDHCRYSGANAGSETFTPMPCLFDNRQSVGDAVLAVALAKHPGAVLAHNYRVAEQALTASAASGNRVTRIDFKPAFEQYAQLVENRYGQQIDGDNFYHMGVHFPFALLRGEGDMLIRIPVAVDDEGALYCVGEIPEGALLSVARAIPPGSDETVRVLLREIQARQSVQWMFFYCAGRRMHLGEAAADELKQLAEQMSPTGVHGVLSLGEIGDSATGGYPLFHNASIVALPLED